VQGGWDKKFDVWDTFIVGGSPDVISVTPDTPYKTLKDLIEAAKKNPNTIKAAASGAGSIHHLNLLAVEKGSGADFNFIPYKGSAPSQNAAMTGEKFPWWSPLWPNSSNCCAAANCAPWAC
jgi:tripartite-type tricarboxylate transporter receptor subunit TctC